MGVESVLSSSKTKATKKRIERGVAGRNIMADNYRAAGVDLQDGGDMDRW